jgi:hypothetical protein
MASETYRPPPVASPRRSPTDRLATPTPARAGGGKSSGTGTIGKVPPSSSGPAIWVDPDRVSTGAPRSSRNSDPGPRLRQLMGVCGWAAVLGGVGLVLGIRGLLGIVTHHAPSWFEPAMSVTGVVGIAFTVGAFLTVQRRRAPWLYLAAGSAVLVVAMVLTSKAF